MRMPDEVYTIQSGDSLSKISQKFAGDNSLIKAIAEKIMLQTLTAFTLVKN